MVWPSANLECRMQVWNVLHAARWKCRTQKIAKNSPSGHHRTTLSDYIFATKAHYRQSEKLVKQQCLSHMFSQYCELRRTNGWDLLASLGHPCKFQRVSRLDSVTARHSGRQPNFAALNRGRHLYSTGMPSRWAWPTFLVMVALCNRETIYIFIVYNVLLCHNQITHARWAFLYDSEVI